MSESPPTATEESGHIWIDTAGGQVNLTAEVIAQFEIITGYRGLEHERLAQAALKNPHIAKALDNYSKVPSGEIGGDHV